VTLFSDIHLIETNILLMIGGYDYILLNFAGSILWEICSYILAIWVKPGYNSFSSRIDITFWRGEYL